MARHNAHRLRVPRAGESFCSLKLDGRWFSPHDSEQLRRELGGITCATALVFGRRSHLGVGGWGARGAAADSAAAAELLLALLPPAAQATAHPLAAGHFLLEDAPLELRDVLAERLQVWAQAGRLGSVGAGVRRAEELGLRALPDCAEEMRRIARRRNGPRVTEAELERMLLED